MTTLKILYKNVYGTDRYYPNCTLSNLFCRLTGTKTLSDDNLATMRALGFTIEITGTTPGVHNV